MSRLSHVPLKKELFMVSLFSIAFVAAVSSAGYFYYQYHTTQQLLSAGTPTDSVKEITEIVGRVGKIMELPSGEQPTLATVSDLSKLQGQPFFARAQNGDKVLIYTNAKKAILYRPGSNKIIEVAPVNFPSQQQVAGASVSVTPVASASPTLVPEEITVAIYNGTNTTGLTRQADRILNNSEMDNLEVTSRVNAQKQDYPSTIVVDVNGNLKVQAEQIAKLLKAKVSPLPKDETKPETDLLIIVGEDFEGN